MRAAPEIARSARLSVSVVIVTYERPEYLERCLARLMQQTRPPDEVFVVDASVSDKSRKVADRLNNSTYISNPPGRGSMTNSRNVGWRVSGGDIVAFIDDDAFAAPDWLEHLVSPYADETVGGVGGRAVRSEFDVADPADRVGALAPDGQLIANFEAAAPVGLDVCHLIGCNMSFRRSVLERVGGFREDYPGTEVREETDLCFRVIEEGLRLRFEPEALVVHVGGPYTRGRRFDIRYEYFVARNHAQLLVRHFGIRAPVVRRFGQGLICRTALDGLRHFTGSFLRVGASVSGFVVGLLAGMRSQESFPFERRSSEGHSALSEWLEAP
jgi:GT2 family glycosyltransferase